MHLKVLDAIEEIDAMVFSGDRLEDEGNRALFQETLKRS